MNLQCFKANNLFALGKVDLNLRNLGLTLITGYSEDEGGGNGSGKSSLCNKGILWTLFGETAGGLRADAVRNRHNKKKCFGEITFVGTDRAKYKIRRERPAKLQLFKDKDEITTTKASETQLLINSLLGIDFKTFIQTSYFGQGRKLSYASLTPKEQKAILEQILPMEQVDIWAIAADLAVKKVTKLSEKTERTHFEVKTKVEAQKATLADTITCREHFEVTKKSKIAAAELQIQEHKDSTSVQAAQLETLQKQADLVDPKEIDQRIQTAQTILDASSDKEARDNYSKAVDASRQWTTRLDYLRNDLKALKGATSCPTCLRDFDDQTVKEVEKKMLQQKTLITEAEATCKLADEAEEYHDKILRQFQDFVRIKQLELQAFQEEKTMALERQNQINKLKQPLQSAQLFLEEKLKLAKEEKNPHTKQVKDHENKVHISEKAEEGARSTMENLKRELEHLIYWRDIYSKELKLKLFEDACPFLDARTAFHLGRLKNQQLHAKFTTIKRLASGAAKEEFNVEVNSDTGGEGFDSFSGGEQQMVSFAIGLALSDLSSRTASGRSLFVILDEPFSELDARNSEAIVEYLVEEMCKDKETVFLISNEEALKGLVSNRIHVVKKQGVSNVER